jgi:hypothetical protein
MISMLARKAQRYGAMKMRNLKRISILTAGEKGKSLSPVKTNLKRRMRWILLRLRTQRLDITSSFLRCYYAYVYVEPMVPVGHDQWHKLLTARQY